MTGKLRIDWKRAVKYSWIATSISLLTRIKGIHFVRFRVVSWIVFVFSNLLGLSLLSQMLSEKCRNLPRINRLPGHFCRGVMTAAEPDYVERQVVSLHLGDYFVRELDREC